MGHSCSECSFVWDLEKLLTFLVPREQKDSASQKPEFVGFFTMPGWNGHSGCYLFKCQQCQNVCVDYPHGFTDVGLLYLRCGKCKRQLVLEVKTEMSIYERERVHILHKKLTQRRTELQAIVTEAEKRGIRVIVPGLPPPRATPVRDWFRRFRFRKKTSCPAPVNEDIRQVIEEDGDDLF